MLHSQAGVELDGSIIHSNQNGWATLKQHGTNCPSHRDGIPTNMEYGEAQGYLHAGE